MLGTKLGQMTSSQMLYSGAACYASVSAFAAFWLTLRMPVQANTQGPYNYHRAIRAGRRVPWKRLRL
ncbi:hypothetical protein MBLNU230_g2069t1 [Neophaeotheca triangularis]